MQLVADGIVTSRAFSLGTKQGVCSIAPYNLLATVAAYGRLKGTPASQAEPHGRYILFGLEVLCLVRVNGPDPIMVSILVG
jgi:hypothetical protein